MIHFSCDSCGKDLEGGSARHVVRIEIYPAPEPAELSEGDLNADHLDDIDEALCGLTDAELENPGPATKKARFDLCDDCKARFAEDPLGLDKVRLKLGFSKN